jgi:hypothetical protein
VLNPTPGDLYGSNARSAEQWMSDDDEWDEFVDAEIEAEEASDSSSFSASSSSLLDPQLSAWTRWSVFDSIKRARQQLAKFVSRAHQQRGMISAIFVCCKL